MTLFTLKSCAIALSLFGTCVSHAGNWSSDSVPPGGVVAIPLSSQFAAFSNLPFGLTEVFIDRSSSGQQALIGVPLKQEAGQQRVTWTDTSGGRHQFAFTVTDFPYPTQHLTIKNKRKVNPNEKDMQRIEEEFVTMRKVYHSFTEQRLSDFNWTLPVIGRQSSAFGLKRFFNEQPRNPHSGLDIAAPEGTPIKAPADGKVVLVGDYFFNGLSVFIDHGQGLVTLYCHMNSIKVKENQKIKRGEVLGTVGKTGRATGPHLHWGVSLNNARVDPGLFLAKDQLAKLTR